MFAISPYPYKTFHELFNNIENLNEGEFHLGLIEAEISKVMEQKDILGFKYESFLSLELKEPTNPLIKLFEYYPLKFLLSAYKDKRNGLDLEVEQFITREKITTSALLSRIFFSGLYENVTLINCETNAKTISIRPRFPKLIESNLRNTKNFTYALRLQDDLCKKTYTYSFVLSERDDKYEKVFVEINGSSFYSLIKGLRKAFNSFLSNDLGFTKDYETIYEITRDLTVLERIIKFVEQKESPQ